MKKIIFTAIILTSAFLFAQDNQVVKQQESTWKLSVGANYRSFGEVNIKQRPVNGGQFFNGSVTDIGGGNYLYTVTDPTTQVFVDATLNDTVTFSTATATAGEFDIDGGLAGITLKGSKILKKNNGFTWSLDLSLTTAYSQSSNTTTPTISDTGFDLGAQDWNDSFDNSGFQHPGPYPPSAPIDGKTEGVAAEYTPFYPANSISSMVVNYDLNLGVYTIGMGLNGAYKIGAVNLFIAGGPTLSVVDYDIDYSAQSGSFSEQISCESTTLRGGLYGEFGLEVSLGEKWGVGISSRYDWIPVELNTDLADFELSGLSGNIFISYNF